MPLLPTTDGNLNVHTGLQPIAPNVFAISATLNFLPGLALPLRMTILRLPDHTLVVYSPFSPSLVDLSALGTVKAIIAPNTMHWMYAHAFHDAHPGSTLYSSPALASRFPEKNWGTVLTSETAEDAIAPGLKVRVLTAWTFFQEVVLLHTASSTLVTADLAFNFTPAVVDRVSLPCKLFLIGGRALRPLDWSTPVKLLGRMGCKDGIKQLDALLDDWQWDRFVPSHGEVVDTGAKDVFRAGVYRYVSDVAIGTDWLLWKVAAVLGAILTIAVGLVFKWQQV